MKDNIIVDKSFNFAVEIVKLCNRISAERINHPLVNQLIRSGTSIGANVSEAINGQIKRDFTSKMEIALKEAGETEYWILLLLETDIIKHTDKDILDKCVEVKKILVSIIKSSKTSKN